MVCQGKAVVGKEEVEEVQEVEEGEGEEVEEEGLEEKEIRLASKNREDSNGAPWTWTK